MRLLSLLALNLWLHSLEAHPLPTATDEGIASATHDFLANFGGQSTPVGAYPSSEVARSEKATHEFLNLDLSLGSLHFTDKVHTGHSQNEEAGSKDLGPTVDQLCCHSVHSSETKAADHLNHSFAQSTILQQSPATASPSFSTSHLTPLGVSEESYPVRLKQPQTLQENVREKPQSATEETDEPMLDQESPGKHSRGEKDEPTQSLHKEEQSLREKAQSLHRESQSMNEGARSLGEEVESLQADVSPRLENSITVGKSLHGRKRVREEANWGPIPVKSRTQRDRSKIQRIGWILEDESQEPHELQREIVRDSNPEVHDRYPEEEKLLRNLGLYPGRCALTFRFANSTARNYYEAIQRVYYGMTRFVYPKGSRLARPNANEGTRLKSIVDQAYKHGELELALIDRSPSFTMNSRSKASTSDKYPKLKRNKEGARFYGLRKWLNRCLPLIIHDIRVLCEIFPCIVADRKTSVKEIQRGAWDFFAFFWNNVDSIDLKGSEFYQRLEKSKKTRKHLKALIGKIDQKSTRNMGFKNSASIGRKLLTIWLRFFDKRLFHKASRGKRQEVNTHFIGLLNAFYEVEE